MITQKEIFGTQNYVPLISYKYWDSKEEKMYIVKEITYTRQGMPVNIIVFKAEIGDGTEIKSYRDGELIPSTGIYDKLKSELFYGDIVVCNFLTGQNRTRVIYWDNGWRVFGVESNEFENNAEDLIIKIGNKFEDTNLYKKYEEKILTNLK